MSQFNLCYGAISVQKDISWQAGLVVISPCWSI